MDAAARMAFCADLGLDLEATYAVMRAHGFSRDEVTEALDAMPRDVLDSWRDTLRLIAVPKKGKSF
jgi:hypothetical protein